MRVNRNGLFLLVLVTVIPISGCVERPSYEEITQQYIYKKQMSKPEAVAVIKRFLSYDPNVTITDVGYSEYGTNLHADATQSFLSPGRRLVTTTYTHTPAEETINWDTITTIELRICNPCGYSDKPATEVRGTMLVLNHGEKKTDNFFPDLRERMLKFHYLSLNDDMRDDVLSALLKLCQNVK